MIQSMFITFHHQVDKIINYTYVILDDWVHSIIVLFTKLKKELLHTIQKYRQKTFYITYY